MKLLRRIIVIAVLTVVVLKLYLVNPTMALVIGAIGFAAVIVWIGET